MFGSCIIAEMDDSSFSKYPTTLRLGFEKDEIVVLELEDVDGNVTSYYMDDKAMEDLAYQLLDILKGNAGGC